MEKVEDRCLDMSDTCAVQVNQDLFAYKKTPSFVCYSNLTSGSVKKTVKATPTNKTHFLFATNFHNDFIFVGGGKWNSQYLKTVEMYTVESNSWQLAP